MLQCPGTVLLTSTAQYLPPRRGRQTAPSPTGTAVARADASHSPAGRPVCRRVCHRWLSPSIVCALWHACECVCVRVQLHVCVCTRARSRVCVCNAMPQRSAGTADEALCDSTHTWSAGLEDQSVSGMAALRALAAGLSSGRGESVPRRSYHSSVNAYAGAVHYVPVHPGQAHMDALRCNTGHLPVQTRSKRVSLV